MRYITDTYKDTEPLKTKLVIHWSKLSQILTLSLLFILIGSFTSKASNTFEFTEQEQGVLSLFDKKCSGHNPSISQYPDGFIGKSIIASCEIASIFNPAKYRQKIATMQIAQVAVGHATYRNELKEADSVLARSFGYPVEEGIMFSPKNMSFSAERAEIDYEQSKLGVPNAIHRLSINDKIAPRFGGAGLPICPSLRWS